MGTKEQETSKCETIAKLYSLRAGLSFLSLIRDEAEKYKSIIENNEYKIQQRFKEQQKLQDNIKYRYSQTVKPVQNEIKILEETIPKYEADLKKREKKFLFFAIICLLVFSISAGLLIFSYLYFHAGENARSFHLIAGIASIFVSLIGFVCSVSGYMNVGQEFFRSETHIVNSKIYTVHYSIDPRFAIGERRQELEQKIEAYQEQCKECEIKIADMQREICDMKKEIKNASEALPPVIAYFQAVHKALREQFCNFIDERDWGNADLIIFNYESGRARNLRDALLQIDDEVRHERLKKAVEYASTAISFGIETESGSLQDIFERNIDTLEKRIGDLLLQMQEIHRHKTYTFTEIGGVRKAMLYKKSTSSSLLAEDVQYMCRLAEVFS